jgi:hypothetical protein
MEIGVRTQLSSQTAARYGIRIDEKNLAWVGARLSQRTLVEASSNLVRRIDPSLKGVESAVDASWKIPRCGVRGARQWHTERTTGNALGDGTKGREIGEEIPRVNTRAMLIHFIRLGALSGLLLFGTGVWVGARCL